MLSSVYIFIFDLFDHFKCQILSWQTLEQLFLCFLASYDVLKSTSLYSKHCSSGCRMPAHLGGPVGSPPPSPWLWSPDPRPHLCKVLCVWRGWSIKQKPSPCGLSLNKTIDSSVFQGDEKKPELWGSWAVAGEITYRSCGSEAGPLVFRERQETPPTMGSCSDLRWVECRAILILCWYS